MLTTNRPNRIKQIIWKYIQLFLKINLTCGQPRVIYDYPRSLITDDVVSLLHLVLLFFFIFSFCKIPILFWLSNFRFCSLLIQSLVVLSLSPIRNSLTNIHILSSCFCDFNLKGWSITPPLMFYLQNPSWNRKNTKFIKIYRFKIRNKFYDFTFNLSFSPKISFFFASRN